MGRPGSQPRRGAAANPALPVLARVRVRFAKRGRLRFLSHRDVARVFEWALRRAAVPVAHSHGFSPHPRLSWMGAAPTGVASEAEYVEIGMTSEVEPDSLRDALDAALPAGLDVLEVVPAAPGGGSLAGRIDASEWRIELPGVDWSELDDAVRRLLAAAEVAVDRLMADGTRRVDVRAAIVALVVAAPAQVVGAAGRVGGCAIMTAVVRQSTPAVRPDDVLGALDVVAGLRPPVPARATRTAQGRLDDRGRLADPFQSDRAAARSDSEAAGAGPP